MGKMSDKICRKVHEILNIHLILITGVPFCRNSIMQVLQHGRDVDFVADPAAPLHAEQDSRQYPLHPFGCAWHYMAKAILALAVTAQHVESVLGCWGHRRKLGAGFEGQENQDWKSAAADAWHGPMVVARRL